MPKVIIASNRLSDLKSKSIFDFIHLFLFNQLSACAFFFLDSCSSSLVDVANLCLLLYMFGQVTQCFVTVLLHQLNQLSSYKLLSQFAIKVVNKLVANLCLLIYMFGQVTLHSACLTPYAFPPVNVNASVSQKRLNFNASFGRSETVVFVARRIPPVNAIRQCSPRLILSPDEFQPFSPATCRMISI